MVDAQLQQIGDDHRAGKPRKSHRQQGRGAAGIDEADLFGVQQRLGGSQLHAEIQDNRLQARIDEARPSPCRSGTMTPSRAPWRSTTLAMPEAALTMCW
jgi:hypothetical protein